MIPGEGRVLGYRYLGIEGSCQGDPDVLVAESPSVEMEYCVAGVLFNLLEQFGDAVVLLKIKGQHGIAREMGVNSPTLELNTS